MFARLVVDLRKLTINERQDLFSHLVTGRVTWDKLVEEYDDKAEKERKVEQERVEALRRLSRTTAPDSPVDGREPPSPLMEPSFPLDAVEIKDPEQPSFRAEIEINKFFDFTLSQRIALARDEDYRTKLFSLARPTGRNELRLKQQMAKDATFQWTAQLIIAYYAELIYDKHSDLTTAQQIAAIKSLISQPEIEHKTNTNGVIHPISDFLVVGEGQRQVSSPELIDEGQEFCQSLLASMSGATDAAEYFRKRLESAVTYQTELVAPFNKTVRYLREYNGEITNSKWDSKAWGLNFKRCPFWAVTPDGIEKSRLLFDEKKGLSGARMDPYEEKSFEPAMVQKTLAESMTILDAKKNSDCLRVPEVTQLYEKYREKGERAFDQEVDLQSHAIARRVAGR